MKTRIIKKVPLRGPMPTLVFRPQPPEGWGVAEGAGGVCAEPAVPSLSWPEAFMLAISVITLEARAGFIWFRIAADLVGVHIEQQQGDLRRVLHAAHGLSGVFRIHACKHLDGGMQYRSF